jgi:N4-gp56 family major capsid protein
MAMMSTSNPADVANRYQQFFSKKLLQQAVNQLRSQEFAMQAELPRNAGSTSITFFRRRAADDSQVQTLVEGVAINTFTEVTTSKVQVSLVQLGEAAKISDIMRWTDIYNWLNQSVEVMGEDCALKASSVIRAAILAEATYGLLNSNGNQERFAGVPNTGNSGNDFATLNAMNAAAAKWTRAGALFAVTQLAANNAPMINGGYVGILAPQIKHDVVQDKDWLEASKYSNPSALYKGEIGSLDGVRYVIDTNPHRENVYGTHSATGAVYSTLYTGKDAYGVAKLAGTQSPYKPQVIILTQPDKSDPANQFVTVTWKAYYAAVTLNKNFIVAYRSKSTFA